MAETEAAPQTGSGGGGLILILAAGAKKNGEFSISMIGTQDSWTALEGEPPGELL